MRSCAGSSPTAAAGVTRGHRREQLSNRRGLAPVRSIAGPSFESIDSDDFLSPVTTLERDQVTKLVAQVSEKDGKVLHPDLLNPRLLEAQYAVRGELYLRAEELKKTKEIIYTNVGNPQALGAKPLTFVRQVIALCAAPFLLDDPNTPLLFPADAIERAKKIIASFGTGGVGGYTDSRGNPMIREEVADFIQARDGHRPSTEHIYLTDGASAGVRNVLQSIIRNEADAVLVPIPQYPLYSASIALYGGKLLPYELDEASGWGLDLDALTRTVAAARAEGYSVRALVFINPGNPTGQCLPGEEVARLVEWCAQQRVVLLSDEVYQELVYRKDRPFTSAYKALMESKYAQTAELISFHSVSKGTSGECGLRGGYHVFSNIHPDTVAQFYKLSSIGLCPNTIGQVVVSTLCNPPQPGDPSYELFAKERADELASLSRRAALVSGAFNSLPNMSVVPTEAAMYAFPQLASLSRRAALVSGAFNSLPNMSVVPTEAAMYAFPQVHMPLGALAAAEAAGKKPDVFYCLAMLEEAGICTIPGSGFGQAAGSQHFRTTFLPREEVMEGFVQKFKAFHINFMEKFGPKKKQ
uniref:alanine transaminase n=1 Tax=Tetradesmus obliquus TaxID=3088 RepID=A0A383W5D9_TETOB